MRDESPFEALLAAYGERMRQLLEVERERDALQSEVERLRRALLDAQAL